MKGGGVYNQDAWTGVLTQQLKVSTAFSVGLGLVPSTHVKQLPMPCSSSSRESDPLPSARHLHVLSPTMAETHICIILFKNQYTRLERWFNG